MKKLLIPAITALALSQNAFAGMGYIQVQIEHLGVIDLTAAGHLAGNMEIKVKDGFHLPAGVYCDTNYITTKRSVDYDRALLSLLRDAKASSRTVSLLITDDPTYTEFPGRCSLVTVSLL